MAQLGWDGCRNARDVGGLPTNSGRTTRAGTVVRTDSLHRLSPAGRAALDGIAAGLVLDLRSDWEMETLGEPHPLDGSPTYVRIPWIDPEAEALRDPESEPSLAHIYRGSLDRNGRKIAAAYRAIAAVPLSAPVVVHCHSGKDRTGLLVAVLLDLVGVPRDLIAADYAISEVLLEITERPADLRTPPEVILDSLDHLDRRYGGARAYLVRIGLTDTEIDQLSARLVGSTIEAVVFDFDGLVMDTETLDFRPGIRAWLTEARELGLRVAIASSSARSWVEGHLVRVGALDLFDVVVTGDDVDGHKPDPAVYLLALSRLGVAGSAAVAVEDTAHGVAAAAAAGMGTIGIPNPYVSADELAGADVVLDSAEALPLREALDLLDPAEDLAS